MPIAAPPALHAVEATVYGLGGSAVHVSARLPPGYRIVLHDPVRLHAAAPQFEIVRGKAQYGVLMLVPVAPLADFTRVDPALPARAQSVRATATSWAVARSERVQRVTRNGYLLLRDGRPVEVFIRLHGALPAVVEGVGSGRALLVAVARTMVVRWVSPVPLGGPSDAAALALRDEANAAIAAQDAYSSTLTGGYTVDTIRSARYQASFGDEARTTPVSRVSGGTRSLPTSAGGCWKAYPAFDTGRFLAPRLPVSAPGLSYGPSERTGGVVRLAYRYWTLDATVRAVQVDLDPATLLPIRSETTDVIGAGPFGASTTQTTWSWGSVTRPPLPKRCPG